MAKKSLPKSLPKMAKSDVKSPQKFNEVKTTKESEEKRLFWILVLAFVLLAAFGVIVWAVLSGRSDQKIHGDNLNSLLERDSASESAEQESEPVIDEPEEEFIIPDE